MKHLLSKSMGMATVGMGAVGMGAVRMGAVGLTALLLLLAAPAPATAQSLSDQVRARYGADSRMSARFVQHISSDFLEMDERYTGRVWIAGDRYRIETGSQTIVSDGKLTWIHNHAERQVLVNVVEEDMGDFSLTSFLGEFDSAYAIQQAADAQLNGESLHVLKLAPTDEFASFKTVTMWIRPADLAVLKLHVVDLNEVSMTFELSDVEFDAPFSEGTYTFAIPDGVEVIDLQ